MHRLTKDFLVADKLESLGELDIRPMFGGLGLFKDRHYFGVITGGQIYLRTSPATIEKYRAAQSEPLHSSEQYTFSDTYKVPSEVVSDSAELCRWAQEAFREAVAAKVVNIGA